MKSIRAIFVILCGISVPTRSQTACEYAPACPDLVSWTIGYICDDNLMPSIKTRVIDGVVSRTMCCKAPKRCEKNFWCSFSDTTTASPMFAINRPSCDSNCASIWKPLLPTNTPIFDGVRAGSFAPGISSFIGRTFIKNELQIGRIQLVPPVGLFYALDGVEKFANSSIEYLTRNVNYIWKNSSNGETVDGAVTMAGMRNVPYYIGRVEVNGLTFIGSVVKSMGLLYYTDGSGIERTTDCYEVLACKNPSTSTTNRPPNSTADSHLDANSMPESMISSNFVNLQPTQNASDLNNLSSGPVIDQSTEAGLSGVDFADSPSVNGTEGNSGSESEYFGSGLAVGSDGGGLSGESDIEVGNLITEVSGLSTESTLGSVLSSESTQAEGSSSTSALVGSSSTSSPSVGDSFTASAEVNTDNAVQSTESSNSFTTSVDKTTEASDVNTIGNDQSTEADYLYQASSTHQPQSTTRSRRSTRTTTKRSSTIYTPSSPLPTWLFSTRSTTTRAPSTTVVFSDSENGEDENKIDSYACVPHWKPLPPNTTFLSDGVDISGLKTDVFSYIGRIQAQNAITPGRIDMKPTAALITFNKNTQNTTNIEYLAKTPTQTYSWTKSSNGLAVRNAITLNELNEWPFLIGKVKVNQKIFIGKVLPSIGLKFLDRYGNEKFTKYYEVLVCDSTENEIANDDACSDRHLL